MGPVVIAVANASTPAIVGSVSGWFWLWSWTLGMGFDLGMGLPLGFKFYGFWLDFASIFLWVFRFRFLWGEVGCCHCDGVLLPW